MGSTSNAIISKYRDKYVSYHKVWSSTKAISIVIVWICTMYKFDLHKVGIWRMTSIVQRDSMLVTVKKPKVVLSKEITTNYGCITLNACCKIRMYIAYIAWFMVLNLSKKHQLDKGRSEGSIWHRGPFCFQKVNLSRIGVGRRLTITVNCFVSKVY